MSFYLVYMLEGKVFTDVRHSSTEMTQTDPLSLCFGE